MDADQPYRLAENEKQAVVKSGMIGGFALCRSNI